MFLITLSIPRALALSIPRGVFLITLSIPRVLPRQGLGHIGDGSVRQRVLGLGELPKVWLEVWRCGAVV